MNCVTINIPVEISVFGELPKDLDLKALGDLVAKRLNYYEDGRKDMVIEVIESSLNNSIRHFATDVIRSKLRTRIKDRMVPTMRDDSGQVQCQTSMVSLLSEKRMTNSKITISVIVGEVKTIESSCGAV